MAQMQICRGVATKIYHDGNSRGSIQCFYHNTCVAERFADGSVTLQTGRWRTATTKTRMNQFSNQFCSGRFHVFQKDCEWFVKLASGAIVPFQDGMTV